MRQCWPAVSVTSRMWVGLRDSSGPQYLYSSPLEVKSFHKCDPPQEFDAKGESTRTTRLHDTLSVP